uniref:Complement component 4 binding protein n=1 Tax=Cricetulus griseus TaxID=10029 RepID=A0A8C2LVY4_CRIGR
AMCPTRVPHGRDAVAWPISRLWRVSDPTLFQMTVIAALWVAVFGKCGPPPDVPGALLVRETNQTDFESQTLLKYSCRPGYSRASSSQTIYCTSGGSWRISISCVKKSCGNPGDLQNGHVEVKTDFSFGSQIEFSCSEGYILIGSSTSHCEIQSKGVAWSDPLPECEIVKCRSPPEISNGKHTGGDEDFYTYGSSVTYRCDPTFLLLGSPSITCIVVNKTVGVWSPSPPTCERIICPQPNISNGLIRSRLRTTYKYKDSLIFACQKGFTLRGKHIIYCGADGNWNPPPPICELSCNFPPNIAHGHYIRSSHYFSTEATYECDEGYRLVGEASISCRLSKWTPAPPQCKALCQKPEIRNGMLSANKDQYIESENVTIQCDSGFAMLGSQSITCLENGTWYPEMPRCVQVSDTNHKFMQCLSNSADVKMALEVYKLSLEIELLELQIEKAKET